MFVPKFLLFCGLALMFTGGFASKPFAATIDLVPVRVLIDVRSTHSDGKHDMATLIHLAEKRGIDALAFTEHDRVSIRFGIEPIANILGYSMQHPSLYTTGLKDFFSALDRQILQHPNIQLFAGTESMPGYTWSGVPFKNLSLHHADRHLITLGIEKPEQVEGLSSYDLSYAHGHQGISLIFWSLLFLVIMGVLIYCRQQKWAGLLAVSFTVLLILWLTKMDADEGADEAFMQSAHQQGLFVIWAHPGTLSGVRSGPMGIKLNTPPYNQRVFEEPTADAFAALYGESDQNTLAGGLWDQYMMGYMLGVHEKPIWAVAAGDYHEEGMANEYLGNFPMDVWATSKKTKAILAAMQQGHMVAWGMKKDQNISLRTLYLEDANGLRLMPGDEAHVRAPLHVVVALTEAFQSASADKKYPKFFLGEWIIDGKLIQTTPLRIDSEQSPAHLFDVKLAVEKGGHVIRLQIKQGLRMVANPFLVHVE
ncbi:MAG: hypothetical protein Q9M20_08630 [Mariprofundaceae bacterium]|nr:hypothetical protein [Mariprofundaceae bacterium]